MTKGVTGLAKNKISRQRAIYHSQFAGDSNRNQQYPAGGQGMPDNQQLRDIQRAMRSPEQWVLRVEYEDSKGNRSERIVSPIRYLSSERLLALCLCRCEPRQFYLDRCCRWELRPAAEYVMPVEIA